MHADVCTRVDNASNVPILAIQLSDACFVPPLATKSAEYKMTGVQTCKMTDYGKVEDYPVDYRRKLILRHFHSPR